MLEKYKTWLARAERYIVTGIAEYNVLNRVFDKLIRRQI